jgi:dihydroorotate dehydrogenase/NAD-dependent dihydropyrimidine dehydrogenase PreA subunit
MSGDLDISVSLGALVLKNPFIVGSGPTVRKVEQIQEAEQSGWAAASLKLAIEPEPYISLPPRYRWFADRQMHAFSAERRLTSAEALSLLEQARKATSDILIFANIAYDGDDHGGWGGLARQFADAGAHALELNLCCPNMSFNQDTTGGETDRATGASLGTDLSRIRRVVAEVLDAVEVPVVAKLTAEGGRIGEAAAICSEAGIHGVGGGANLLGIPDFDIRSPESSIYRLQEPMSLACLSGPWIKPLALRDTYQMRRSVGGELFVAASGGVFDLSSAVQHIMAGADALWVCTATMIKGFGWLPKLLRELEAYMREMGFRRLRDFRDRLQRVIVPASELQIAGGFAVVDQERCTRCGACWKIGHCAAISHPDGATAVDPESCLACSTCVDVCPQGAIRMVGHRGGRA